MVDVVMRFIKQLSTSSDLNSSKMRPRGVWPFYVLKKTYEQTQISVASTLFLCRTYYYCLHESPIHYLMYLVRKRTFALTCQIPIVHLIHIPAHTYSTSTHIVLGEYVSFVVQQQLYHASFAFSGHISFDHRHKGTASILRQR